MHSKTVLLADFLGDWRLTRQITDALHGQDGQLDGLARFASDGDGLHYTENGQLTLTTGAVLQADRTYLWNTDANGIAVRFADGTAFHRFDPIGHTTGTTHLCGADTYNVAYDFEHWPNWSATWNVTGPRKNYRSISRYNRA
ncbi:MAG: hypothetical protein ACI82I_001067 [Gammaproteobacteria bacterium]|jgi:hypothetical protein